MNFPRLIFLLFIALLCVPNAFGWGFWAHQRINRLAVFTLPPELLGLYKDNIDFLTEHAVDPDKRRYAVNGEAAHHFIDIDHYGEYPFNNVPRYWDQAVEKLTADTLEAYGVVPYHLPVVLYRLTKAFEAQDLNQIMKLSADLGHYIGDAHVPLHTTENYNGQMTGQKGIHGFWESRLPELFGGNYDFFVGKAYFIQDIYMEGWDAVLESHKHVGDVLDMEKALSQTFPQDRKYGYESRNNITVRTYSREYSAAYHKMMSGMVESRMRKAILRIGAYWLTAWKLAGEPDLSGLRKNAPLKFEPEEYDRRLKIEDREAYDLGAAFMRPGQQAKPMGIYSRIASAERDARLEAEKRDAFRQEYETAMAYFAYKQRPWYEKVWDWMSGAWG